MKFNLVKWRLMLTTLPVTAIILTAKLALIHLFHYEGLVKFSDIGIVITGGIFLIGFMLAGTMSDYKESEKLPAEFAGSLETLEDTIIQAHGVKGGFDLAEARKQIQDLTQTLLNWFDKGEKDETMYAKLSDLTSLALILERIGTGPLAARMISEQSNLRKTFSRTSVIRRTNFLATGYALLEVLSFIIICLLMISRFEHEVVSIIIVCFISQIFVYMIRLIKDVDQPFEYQPDGSQRASDVDLFPLLEYQQRSLARRL